MTLHSMTVAPGQLATIVTDLEMRARPAPKAGAASPLRLKRWKMPATDKYRMLFRRVGEPWLWFSRLMLTDEALAAIIHHPAVEIFAVVDRQGIEVGMLELDFRKMPTCEIAFFGLIPPLTGRGHGGWLMAQALALAWRDNVACVWLHTCTLDDPRALGFYLKQGFVATAREIETLPDPRLTGLLPRDAAPHIPIIE